MSTIGAVENLQFEEGLPRILNTWVVENRSKADLGGCSQFRRKMVRTITMGGNSSYSQINDHSVPELVLLSHRLGLIGYIIELLTCQSTKNVA